MRQFASHGVCYNGQIYNVPYTQRCPLRQLGVYSSFCRSRLYPIAYTYAPSPREKIFSCTSALNLNHPPREVPNRKDEEKGDSQGRESCISHLLHQSLSRTQRFRNPAFDAFLLFVFHSTAQTLR